MSAPASEGARRADAQRNRSLLLAAAAKAFSERGIDVPAEEIARRAGVAKGTLFRHFPTKSELIAAVLIERMEQLRRLIEEVAAEQPPGLAAVASIMFGGAEVLASDRSYFDAAMADADAASAVEHEKLALEAALDGLVEAAQRSGELRDDVTGIDVAMLMMAATNTCAPAQPFAPDLWRRYVALMVDGLRPGATTPLPVAAVGGAQKLALLAADAYGALRTPR